MHEMMHCLVGTDKAKSIDAGSRWSRMINERKQEVAFVTAGMAGGGTERVIAVVANYLATHAYKVKIWMTSRDEVVYEIHPDIEVQAIGKRTGGSVMKRVKRIFALRKLFKANKRAVIVSFGTETNLFVLMAHIGLRNRVIVSERNDPNQCSFKTIRNLIYRLADHFVFQTEDARQCFSKKIAERGVVIPNPLAGEMQKGSAGERTRDIVAVGRLEPQKNHELLLRAYQLFDREYPGYRLVLYGEGFLREKLEQLADKLQIRDRVVFAGFSDQVGKRIRNAAMYVLSSDYEGISNSLMEAMALGLPVISTDCPIGGSRMLITDKINGLLTPVGDEKAFAAAMCYVAEDSERAAKMGEAAEYVRNEYSAENICKKWLGEIIN